MKNTTYICATFIVALSLTFEILHAKASIDIEPGEQCIYSSYSTLKHASKNLLHTIQMNHWKEGNKEGTYIALFTEEQCRKTYSYKIILRSDVTDNGSYNIYVLHSLSPKKYFFKGQPLGNLTDPNQVEGYVEYLGTNTLEGLKIAETELHALIQKSQQKLTNLQKSIQDMEAKMKAESRSIEP
ncbi:MAG: hypothetical protein KDD52_06980 [Bdellovibrionales bacterium]|nr:hypothetical protein [Bdellovibrionales bacterium]